MSNLPIISKILEKVIAIQLMKYGLKINYFQSINLPIDPSVQLKPHFFVLLLDITKLLAVKTELALLTMMNMSAAFDTADHSPSSSQNYIQNLS